MPASRYNLWMDRRILESKAKMRKELASLSFTDKIKILEKLRDRSEVIAASGLKRKASRDDGGKAAETKSIDSGSLELPVMRFPQEH